MGMFEEIQQQVRQLPLLQRLKLESWLHDFDESPSIQGVREALPAYEVEEPFFMTLERYFELEERSPVKHEFVNGFIFAMSGPSLAHNAVIGNLAFAFRNRLKRGACNVFTSEIKVVIRKEGSHISYYPDVIVDCRADARDSHSVGRPKLIVEVLSPSTHVTDRREKLCNYTQIESVEEYVLAAQDEPRLVIHRRADGWRPQVYAGVDAVAEFRSTDWTVPLSELYLDVPGLPLEPARESASSPEADG